VFVLFLWQTAITLKVIDGLHPGVTTVALDNLAAETAATMTTKHPDYAVLAARIAVSNLHKETKKVFTGISLATFLNSKCYADLKKIKLRFSILCATITVQSRCSTEKGEMLETDICEVVHQKMKVVTTKDEQHWADSGNTCITLNAHHCSGKHRRRHMDGVVFSTASLFQHCMTIRITIYKFLLFITDVMDDLFNYYNPATQAISPMISTKTHDIVMKNADRLNSAIIYDRDYAYNYFGFKVPADIIHTLRFTVVTLKKEPIPVFPLYSQSFCGFSVLPL